MKRPTSRRDFLGNLRIRSGRGCRSSDLADRRKRGYRSGTDRRSCQSGDIRLDNRRPGKICRSS